MYVHPYVGAGQPTTAAYADLVKWWDCCVNPEVRAERKEWWDSLSKITKDQLAECLACRGGCVDEFIRGQGYSGT